MKSERQPPKFTPVTLLLESQLEVDAVYALLNHSDLVETVGLGDADAFESLEPYRNLDNTDKLHSALCKIVRKK